MRDDADVDVLRLILQLLHVKDFISFKVNLLDTLQSLLEGDKVDPLIFKKINVPVIDSIAELRPGVVNGQLSLACFAAIFLESDHPRIAEAIREHLRTQCDTAANPYYEDAFLQLKTTAPSYYYLRR